MPTYTNDWFDSTGLQNFSALTDNFKDREVRGLEIGCFEGRSTNWIVENWCTHEKSRLTCVDPFTGSVENSPEEKDGLFERFISNVESNLGKIRLQKRPSLEVLTNLISLEEKFDFAYIDGDHHNFAVLTDAMLVDKLLVPGGVVIFDDYGWGADLPPYDRPREAIEYFLNVCGEKYKVILVNWQVVAVKLS